MANMEIRPVEGSARGERTKGWFASAWHQWSSFTPRCNWRDFTLLNLGGEWNHQSQRVEVEVCLLGFWLRVTYVWGDDFVRGLMDMRDEMEAHPERLVELDLGSNNGGTNQ